MSSVMHLELHAVPFPLRPQLVEPTASACVTSLFDARFQRIGEKPESIEQRALSYAVLADYRCHRSQGLSVLSAPQATGETQATQRHFLEHLEVSYSEAFDSLHITVLAQCARCDASVMS